ncbi:hypothetical protein HZS_1464 [Henneguya salminicola]|nr:hypothetical protein HZS_1464 [Henneguya salminicola]
MHLNNDFAFIINNPVLDSSDVIFQVLDARDPEGTRSYYIEKYLRENKAYKHLIFVLNKCDLVPNSKHWMYLLSKDNPTVAFRAGIQRSFGKSSIFSLLRQFSKVWDISHIICSVGFIGYPNVGKSSIINTLVGRKVCTVAPIPGETKVWQFISLMKRVHLIDCPGVVYSTNDTESDIIMKGVVRVEYIKEPSQYMPEILKRVRQEYLSRTYGVISWTDANDFLQKVSHKSGRLLKGGEPDLETVSKMIINDFQRGKLPYFVPPPKFDASQQQIPQPDIVIKIDEQKLEEINKTAEFLPSHINATL